MLKYFTGLSEDGGRAKFAEKSPRLRPHLARSISLDSTFKSLTCDCAGSNHQNMHANYLLVDSSPYTSILRKVIERGWVMRQNSSIVTKIVTFGLGLNKNLYYFLILR